MAVKKLRIVEYEMTLNEALASDTAIIDKINCTDVAKFRSATRRKYAAQKEEALRRKQSITSFLDTVGTPSRTARIRLLPHDLELLVEKGGNHEAWLYQNVIYAVTGTYTDDEKVLLILECADKERQMFERLKAKFFQEASDDIRYERTRIPEDVRIAVWRRDQGRCARCGSRQNLEYDHIVPVSRGGSNTARNVELLCEPCNREKGNRIQ